MAIDSIPSWITWKPLEYHGDHIDNKKLEEDNTWLVVDLPL